MRKTIIKWFWAWGFDKEEKWLNEMSENGLQLVNVSFIKYVFEEGTPKEYTYRLEFLENFPSHAESVQYIKFLEETGAEHIASVNRWAYFKKKSSDGQFDLFSDIDSRIKHLNRISLLFIPFILFNFFMGMQNLDLGLLVAKGAKSESLFVAIVNSYASILCFLAFILLGYGYIVILLKKNKLKKERALRE